MSTFLNKYNSLVKTTKEILNIAARTIIDEAEAVAGLAPQLSIDFALTVEKIVHSNGRVIVTGIGKSANIATKIVATFNSTGTPAIFMHAADAIHGDLGIIQPDDMVICLSKSGNTPEIKLLVPLIRSLGNTIIAIVGNMDSYLAQQADLVLNASVSKEACPNNLAPTASTTAQLVIGDALAVCLLECRGFSQEDFARYHPGGALGKRLYLRVADVFPHNAAPAVDEGDNIRSVIMEISGKRLGTTAVLSQGKLIGIITDGDLRRMLEKNPIIENICARDIMSLNPRTIDQEVLVVNALRIMKENNITQLLVLDDDQYVGVIHLHDILREGVI